MAVTFSLYDDFKTELLNADVDLLADTIKCILGSSSMTFNAANTLYSDISANELATANGYTAAGATLANKAISIASNIGKWDADDVTWTASGGSIAAAMSALYSTTNSNHLIGHINFGATSTAGDGTTFKIQWHANGILTLT